MSDWYVLAKHRKGHGFGHTEIVAYSRDQGKLQIRAADLSEEQLPTDRILEWRRKGDQLVAQVDSWETFYIQKATEGLIIE